MGKHQFFKQLEEII